MTCIFDVKGALNQSLEIRFSKCLKRMYKYQIKYHIKYQIFSLTFLLKKPFQRRRWRKFIHASSGVKLIVIK